MGHCAQPSQQTTSLTEKLEENIDASSVGRHHHPTNQGQLAGDSVMLTSRGKLMVQTKMGYHVKIASYAWS